MSVKSGAYIFAAEDDALALDGVAQADNLFIDAMAGPDEFPNPGFEDGMSGGWTTWSSSGVGFTISDTVAHSGSRSAYDVIEQDDYFGIIYQERPLLAGEQIYASAWGKSEISPLANAKGGLIIQFFDSQGWIEGADLKSEIGGDTDWRELYVEGVTPAGTISMKVGAFVWAGPGDLDAVGGLLYIDDFVVSEDPIPPPTLPADIINGDFENGMNDWLFTYRSFAATDEYAYSGSLAAKHEIGQTNDIYDYLADAYQEIPFSEGRNAYVGMWVKTVILPQYEASGGVRIAFLDAADVELGSDESSISGNTDWTLLFATGVAPAGTAKLRISGFAWALKNQGIINGDVYLDNAVFSETPPGDLILNPGFENGLSGWDQGDGYPMRTVDLEQHSGLFSAEATIEEVAGPDDYWSEISQEFSLNPGEDVYATLWAKTDIDPLSSASAGLQIDFLDINGDPIAGETLQDTIGGQTDWRELYVSSAAAPAATNKVRISCFTHASIAHSSLGGLAYFDDVVASLEPIIPPSYETELLNTGFEDGSLFPWRDLYGIPTVLDDVNPYEAVYSAKKEIGVTPGEDYYSIVFQDIYYDDVGTPFPVDQDAWLTALVRSDIDPQAVAVAGIKLESHNGIAFAEIDTDQVMAFNGWRRLYATGTIPAGTTKVRVSALVWALEGDAYAEGGTANFDYFNYSYIPISAPPLQSYLKNRFFENGLNDWEVPFKPATVITDPVHAGIYAAQFEVDDVTTDYYYGQLSQDVACRAGKTVRAKVWAKTDLSPMTHPSTRAGITILFLDSNEGVLALEYEDIGGITPWEYLEVGRRAPSGTVKIRFICSLRAELNDEEAVGGKAYFDDAYLSITGGGGGCLLPGTRITLADGSLKAIEEITMGDKVLGVDKDGKLVSANVIDTFVHPDTEGFLTVKTKDGKALKTTPNHPVRNCTKYVEAGKLKAGDSVSVLNNKKLTQSKIARIIKDTSTVDVYNLEVDGVHNYFAEGCLVHNKMHLMMVADPLDGGTQY